MPVLTEIIIDSGVGSRKYFRELWSYRELFLLISIRDVLVRYRQAVLGICWAIVRPLLVLLFFSHILGQIYTIPSDVPYSLFVLTAAPVWILFSGSVQDSIGCLHKNAGIISRVYFPRLLLVGASISVNLVDFSIGMVLAIGSALILGHLSFHNIWIFPLAVATLFVCVAGWSIWVAALNSRYRDLGNVAPFLLQLLLVASPVGYASQSDSAAMNSIYYINPLFGIIDAFRYSLLNYPVPDVFFGLFLSSVQSLIVLLTGFYYFRKIEDILPDVI